MVKALTCALGPRGCTETDSIWNQSSYVQTSQVPTPFSPPERLQSCLLQGRPLGHPPSPEHPSACVHLLSRTFLLCVHCSSWETALRLHLFTAWSLHLHSIIHSTWKHCIPGKLVSLTNMYRVPAPLQVIFGPEI